MTTPVRETRRLRGACWTLAAATAAVTLTSSGVAYRMSSPKPTRVLGEQFAASSTTGTTAASAGNNNGCGNGNGGSSGAKDCSNPGHPITVSGSVLGSVFPGAASKLRLQIVNPNTQDLTLQSASASVGTPSKSGCVASWFSVQPYAGTPAVILKKSSTTPVDLVFSMSDKPLNQDACKGAKIPLTFTATATS